MKDALAAVEKLHNHVLQDGDGGGTGPRGKKSKAGASSGTLLWARQVSGEGAHLKKWRLILRNLPFNVRASCPSTAVDTFTIRCSSSLCRASLPCMKPALGVLYMRQTSWQAARQVCPITACLPNGNDDAYVYLSSRSWLVQVKEADLRELLAPAGFVWELTVPRNPDGATLCISWCTYLAAAFAILPTAAFTLVICAMVSKVTATISCILCWLSCATCCLQARLGALALLGSCAGRMLRGPSSWPMPRSLAYT